jgi:hypothetical protein
MAGLLSSLSLASGSVVVAVVVAVMAALLVRRFRRSFVWLACLAVSFALSYCMYWSPVWLGSDPTEYFVWEQLVVGAWSIAGTVAATLAVLILGRRVTP